MSVKRFKFVSPGVFVNEIDNSQLPAVADRLGPVIIGRTERGPSMRPVTVSSQADFVEMFGNAIPGGRSGDVWREGNYQSPTYASYAAMAYLRNNTPATIVRLLGHSHPNKSATGEAGWKVNKEAYGLWLWNSGSCELGTTATSQAQVLTGTLAAIWYCDVGVVSLSGTFHLPGAAYPEGTTVSGTCVAIRSVGPGREFKASVYESNDENASPALTTTFNFNKNSDKFIRKVFNTNPALLDSDTISGDSVRTYFLGQTFEDQLEDILGSGSISNTPEVVTEGSGTIAGDTVGMITKLDNGAISQKRFQFDATKATTSWVISQQIGNDTGSYAAKTAAGCNKLFRLNSLDSGEWDSSNLKVSIEDIRYSRVPDENPYGSFTVSVRKREDNDATPKYVERFPNCNLNPQSVDYVKRKVGDQTLSWDEGERRYKVVGDYPNNSKFVACEVNPELDNAALDTQLLPFGFIGPPRFLAAGNHTEDGTTLAVLQSTSDGGSSLMFGNPATTLDHPGGQANGLAGSEDLSSLTTNKFYFGNDNLRLEWPKIRLRTSSDEGDLSNRKQAFWGVSTAASGSSKATNRGWGDLTYPLPDSVADGDASTETQWGFSLDDVRFPQTGHGTIGGIVTWAEGNRTAFPSLAYSMSGSDGSNGTYKLTLDAGINNFTMPLWGGFDGLDIAALDPFAPDIPSGLATNPTDKLNYGYYSVRKAIDTCADPDVVECNLITVPGITSNGINQHLINVAERRADCLAILDLKNGYLPRANRDKDYTTFAEYGGSVDTTLSNLKDLGINSSYACAYYPWVQIRDTAMDATVWVPPSVVALGTMGSSEAKSEVWFAPAGFTRGGLSEGSAGMPVIGVRDRLTSKQRDKLYQQNVNPIATFPAEGIVIFGQKTMQVTTSALDRINVRRLMIFVKKEISRMAATMLFDQNVQSTWNRFLGRVNPFLRSVQTRLGLTAFKVILDETTTTPELIDRNIMYAKILLKPARAIEFIAIDFVITDSGASFED